MGTDRMSTAARIDELLGKFEENPRRYFAPLANEYRKAGDLSQAIALCREHLPKQPGHMSGHIVFGQALFEHGDLDEAKEVFEAALGLDPENLIALRHLGDIARQRGDASAARRWYGRVLDADPRNDDIAALLAALTARATPASTAAVTPVATDVIGRSGPGADPFADADAPAWHTPAFLEPATAHADAAPAPSVDPAVPAVVELIDLDAPGEPEVPSSTAPAALDGFAATHAEVEVLDGAEPSIDVVPALDVVPSFDGASALKRHVDAAPTTGSIDAALDAFASHDPLDESVEPIRLLTPDAGAPAFESPADAVAIARDAFEVTTRVEEAADVGEIHADIATGDDALDVGTSLEFEEGLLAEEWPIAEVLAASPRTPTWSSTPAPATPVVPEAWEEGAPAAEIDGPAISADPEPSLSGVGVEALDADDLASALLMPVDEDPPLSAAEMSWLSIAEEEQEAVGAAALVLEPAAETPAAVVSAESVPDEAVQEIDRLHAELTDAGTWEDDAVAVEEAPADAAPQPAFVTETMAELLVAQGFVPRAIDVYEELVRRRPHDEVLVSRLAELRGSLAVVEAPTEVTSPSATPVAAPLIAPGPRRTARDWLSELARRRVARRTPVAAAPIVGAAASDGGIESAAVVAGASSAGAAAGSAPPAYETAAYETPADGLASLFGSVGEPAADDVRAAASLASAFGATPTADVDLFDAPATDAFARAAAVSTAAPSPDAAAAVPPSHATPARATTVEAPGASRSGDDFSFDRFFPDPARAPQASAASGGTDDAPSSAAGLGGSGNAADSAQELAQFASWLKGLANP